MKQLLGSALFRVAAVLVLGLGALQLAILLAVIWPDGRPAMYRLVDPADAREIAEALEAVPPQFRPAVARAASVGGTSVRLLAGMPEQADEIPDLRTAPRLNARFRAYAEELEGRELLVQVRRGAGPGVVPGADAPAGPMRVLVRLSTGEVIVIERAPLVLRQLASRYGVVAAAATAVVAVLLLVLWLQLLRPLTRLAGDARSLRYDGRDDDLPVSGGREIRDLTSALNAMKRRIARLVEERTDMLAAIAHDLRTYLTRLRLRAEFIADDEQRDRAERDLSEMAQLLDDILLFAAARNETPAASPVIDAREEILSIVEVRQEAGDPVACEVPAAALPCRCGPLAFRRIVGNLVDNAIHYGNAARIAVRPVGSRVQLTVTDNGPGIPAAMIDTLTRPFTRLEQSRGRHSGGAGLGLAIVKSLAESFGGSLSLRNRPKGGLEAVVILPGGEESADQRDAGL